MSKLSLSLSVPFKTRSLEISLEDQRDKLTFLHGNISGGVCLLRVLGALTQTGQRG